MSQAASRVLFTTIIAEPNPRRPASRGRNRPVISGLGPIDYRCGSCGSTLATGMTEGSLSRATFECTVCWRTSRIA